MSEVPREFTSNWHHEPDKWMLHLSRFKGLPVLALEIGSYEGRSTCWLFDHILTHPLSKLVCVDPYEFSGVCSLSEEEANHYNIEFDLVSARRRFLNNTREYGARREWVETTSYRFLTRDDRKFDIITIDGAHIGLHPLVDLVLSWLHLNPGGVIIMDDIEWIGAPEAGISGHWPKTALKGFLACCPECKLLYQSSIAILEKPLCS